MPDLISPPGCRGRPAPSAEIVHRKCDKMDIFKLIVTFLLNIFYDFSKTEYMYCIVFFVSIIFAWNLLWRLIKWGK